MEITFSDKKLKKLCEDQKEAQKKLGKNCTRKLHSRLEDMKAVAVVTELMAGRPHPLKGDRSGQFALDLEGGTRLVFEAANDPVPLKNDGTVDWSKVNCVRIIFIGDYHD